MAEELKSLDDLKSAVAGAEAPVAAEPAAPREPQRDKLGRVLAVGDVLIFSDGGVEPVARASLTYSIPPERNGVK